VNRADTRVDVPPLPSRSRFGRRSGGIGKITGLIPKRRSSGNALRLIAIKIDAGWASVAATKHVILTATQSLHFIQKLFKHFLDSGQVIGRFQAQTLERTLEQVLPLRRQIFGIVQGSLPSASTATYG
jgi:hypothetical protein